MRRSIFAVVLLAGAPLLGCLVPSAPQAGGGGGRPVVTRITDGQPVQPAQATTVQNQAAVGVQFVNATGREVCRLFVSPATENSWGDDVLGRDTMPPGSSITLALPSAVAQWDLLATDCGGEPLAEMRGWPVPADGIWTISASSGLAAVVGSVPAQAGPEPGRGGSGRVQIVNRTGRQVCYLFVSVAGAEWGPDRLGSSETLEDGESTTVEIDPAVASWDYRAEDCDHAPITDVRGVPLPADGVWVLEQTVEMAAGGDGGGGGGGGSSSGGVSARLRAAILGAAYWFGASASDREDLDDALQGRSSCLNIDDSDLEDLCDAAVGDGPCLNIRNEDLKDFCDAALGDGPCLNIRNGDLEDFCDAVFGNGSCMNIDDDRLEDICDSI